MFIKFNSSFKPHIVGMKIFVSNLFNPGMAVPALKVSLLIGYVLFRINHGVSLYGGKMTAQRWVSVLLSYLVPYLVSINGRSASKQYT